MSSYEELILDLGRVFVKVEKEKLMEFGKRIAEATSVFNSGGFQIRMKEIEEEVDAFLEGKPAKYPIDEK